MWGLSAAQRAECTPGAPPSASSSNPESSAMTNSPGAYRLYASAFLRALASNVLPSSRTDGRTEKFGSGAISISYFEAAPAKPRIFPGFEVAISIRRIARFQLAAFQGKCLMLVPHREQHEEHDKC